MRGWPTTHTHGAQPRRGRGLHTYSCPACLPACVQACHFWLSDGETHLIFVFSRRLFLGLPLPNGSPATQSPSWLGSTPGQHSCPGVPARRCCRGWSCPASLLLLKGGTPPARRSPYMRGCTLGCRTLHQRWCQCTPLSGVFMFLLCGSGSCQSCDAGYTFHFMRSTSTHALTALLLSVFCSFLNDTLGFVPFGYRLMLRCAPTAWHVLRVAAPQSC
jgi:hypothetical protein